MGSIETVQLKKDEKLNIANDGGLSFFWPGVGAAFAKKNFQTNPLIIKGKDHILIDCGSRCSSAFWHYGAQITDIKNILITHSHADHIGGLEEIALMGRYATKRKPRIYITEEYQKILWEQSLKGGCSYNEKHGEKNLEFIDFFEPVRPQKLFDQPRTVYQTYCGEIDIKMFRTMHIPDNAESWKDSFISYGILIDERVLFTADTRYDIELIRDMTRLYKNIEAIFHDTQLFTGGVHAGYEELKGLPGEIKKKTLLVHYGDNYESFHPENDGFYGFVRQGCYYNFK